MSMSGCIRDFIAVFGIGMILVQIFKSSGDTGYSSLMKMSTYALMVIPVMNAADIISQNSAIIKVCEFIAYIAQFIMSIGS